MQDKKNIYRKRNRRIILNRILFHRILILVSIPLLIWGWLFFTWKKLPSKIHLKQGTVEEFDFAIPAIARISKREQKIGSVDLMKPVTLYATDTDSYRMSIELFGFINFKETEVSVINDVKLKPVGKPIGIYVKTKGILVLQSGEFMGEDGFMKKPSALLQEGDYILAYNGEEINFKREMIEKINASNGEPIVLTIKRGEEIFDILVTPAKNEAGEYKLGIWIRDNAQGVGTMTYVTQNNEFGALGHGINDMDTSALMELDYGSLYQADIISIKKGNVGEPGEITGYISYEKEDFVGKINENTTEGIYGIVRKSFAEEVKEDYFSVGLKQEVHTGPVEILCTLDDTPCYYEGEITAIYTQNESTSRGFRIRITDEELLTETGGIVQGMSGSPIIQNGKLIGAVTHVLVNDPTKGYGIFIEDMLEH